MSRIGVTCRPDPPTRVGDPRRAGYPDVTPPSYIPVLLYHAIGGDRALGLREFSLGKQDFTDHVVLLRRHADDGATPMLIRDLAAALRGERPLPDRPFAVTFDDGYADNDAAIRTLADAGIPSTIYVTTGFIGRPNILSRTQIRDLARHPLVDVGAHTVRHIRLDELPRADIAREMRDGRAVLRQITDTDVSSVAYPHGALDKRVVDEARRAGYTSGVAVKNRLSRPGDDPWAIARWTVLAGYTGEDLARVMDGKIPIVGRSERLQTRGYRAVRRCRRALLHTARRVR